PSGERHTRWPRDWSSDVCSSDLCQVRLECARGQEGSAAEAEWPRGWSAGSLGQSNCRIRIGRAFRWLLCGRRGLASKARGDSQKESEERRVGKECRFEGPMYH